MADLVNDWAYRHDSLAKSVFYFNSFYCITNLIIISLLTGLVWEVFTYMEKQFAKQQKIEEELAALYYAENDRRSPNKRRPTDAHTLLNKAALMVYSNGEDTTNQTGLRTRRKSIMHLNDVLPSSPRIDIDGFEKEPEKKSGKLARSWSTINEPANLTSQPMLPLNPPMKNIERMPSSPMPTPRSSVFRKTHERRLSTASLTPISPVKELGKQIVLTGGIKIFKAVQQQGPNDKENSPKVIREETKEHDHEDHIDLSQIYHHSLSSIKDEKSSTLR